MLRTPSAIEGEGGASSAAKKKANGNMIMLRDQMADLAVENGLKSSVESLLPTPNTMDMLPRRSDEALARSKAKGGTSNLKDAEIVRNPTTSWGKFEPAIRRWELVTGREVPAPTKPDGKDGSHRLSSEFAEWMMGLPAGWITEVGIGRSAELKACGNGVVPQQAMLALSLLISKDIMNKITSEEDNG
jgi:DNA (cytosine-5)-methyltransferase 1